MSCYRASLARDGLSGQSSSRRRLQMDGISGGSWLAVLANGDIDIATEPSQQPHQAFHGHVAKLTVEQP